MVVLGLKVNLQENDFISLIVSNLKRSVQVLST